MFLNIEDSLAACSSFIHVGGFINSLEMAMSIQSLIDYRWLEQNYWKCTKFSKPVEPVIHLSNGTYHEFFRS